MSPSLVLNVRPALSSLRLARRPRLDFLPCEAAAAAAASSSLALRCCRRNNSFLVVRAPEREGATANDTTMQSSSAV